MNNLLKLLDLSSKEIEDILNLADQYKYERSHGIARNILEKRTLGMLFQTPSTRTRVSFEVGMYHLGGHALYLPVEELQVGRGEQTEDTARALSRYCDALMVRAFEQDELEYLARYGTIPVINGMTEFAHPCQTLADLMTIREYKTRLDGLKVAFIGNGGCMMNSTIVGALKCRMNVAVACPENYDPAQEVLDFAAQVGHFEMYRDPRGAARAEYRYLLSAKLDACVLCQSLHSEVIRIITPKLAVTVYYGVYRSDSLGTVVDMSKVGNNRLLVGDGHVYCAEIGGGEESFDLLLWYLA